MGTALVVGLLIVMCGGIAYVGDLLGRRMGKKRLSVFNLRPRHTAVVFTIITGMVIAAITLGALMLLSRGVRIAVTRGEQLLYENHRLKQQRRRLDVVRRQLVAQREDLEKSNRTLVDGNQALQAAQSRLRAETANLQQHNQALQAQNDILGIRNRRLEAHNTRLVNGNHSLAERNQALSARNNHLGLDNRHLTDSNDVLIASNAHLTSRNRALQTEIAGLTQARSKAKTQLTNLHVDLDHTRGDLSQAQKELDNAKRVLNETQARANSGEDLAVGNVIVHRGEELARRVVPAGAPDDVVRSTLRGLLDDANAEVARRVSRVNGRARQVCLDPAAGPRTQLPEAMITEIMTERESHPSGVPPAAGQTSDMHSLVVRAIATRNISDESADPVIVAIDGQVNQMAYHKGDEVAQMEVSTATTTGRLLKYLVAFLQRQVREQAVRHSIMPDASGSVGEIDYEELLDVVARIKRLPGRVRIGAVATSDAWSAGPLELDFYVVPAETQVAKKKGEE
jgi:uncharacterized protein (DUF3084 family)